MHSVSTRSVWLKRLVDEVELIHRGGLCSIHALDSFCLSLFSLRMFVCSLVAPDEKTRRKRHTIKRLVRNIDRLSWLHLIAPQAHEVLHLVPVTSLAGNKHIYLHFCNSSTGDLLYPSLSELKPGNQ